MNIEEIQRRQMLQTFLVERNGKVVEVMVDREAINLPEYMSGHGFIAMTAEQAAVLEAARAMQ